MSTIPAGGRPGSEFGQRCLGYSLSGAVAASRSRLACDAVWELLGKGQGCPEPLRRFRISPARVGGWFPWLRAKPKCLEAWNTSPKRVCPGGMGESGRCASPKESRHFSREDARRRPR